MFRKFKGGQGIIEYTMLIIIVAAALMAMSTYIMRSVNARIKQTQDELDKNSY
ncbi:MAG: hypothetical protein AAB089_04495 [Nitrospirota bacterium]